jgi:hypothetical protein
MLSTLLFLQKSGKHLLCHRHYSSQYFNKGQQLFKKKVESIYYVIGITVPNISTKGNNSEEKAKWKAFIISASLSLRLNSSKTTL